MILNIGGYISYFFIGPVDLVFPPFLSFLEKRKTTSTWMLTSGGLWTVKAVPWVLISAVGLRLYDRSPAHQIWLMALISWWDTLHFVCLFSCMACWPPLSQFTKPCPIGTYNSQMFGLENTQPETKSWPKKVPIPCLEPWMTAYLPWPLPLSIYFCGCQWTYNYPVIRRNQPIKLDVDPLFGLN